MEAPWLQADGPLPSSSSFKGELSANPSSLARTNSTSGSYSQLDKNTNHGGGAVGGTMNSTVSSTTSNAENLKSSVSQEHGGGLLSPLGNLRATDQLHLSIQGVDPSLKFARTGSVGFLWPVPLKSQGMDDELAGLPPQTGASSSSNPTMSSRHSKGSASSAANLYGNKGFVEGGVPPTSMPGWDRLVFGGLPYEMVLFVLGNLEDMLVINGLKHFPEDLERSVEISLKTKLTDEGW
jgi:hypothetical protein